jgi:hypothetical protein
MEIQQLDSLPQYANFMSYDLLIVVFPIAYEMGNFFRRTLISTMTKPYLVLPPPRSVT